MAGLVAVYADDLAEKVKKRVATLTRQAHTSLQHDLRRVAIVAVLVITYKKSVF